MKNGDFVTDVKELQRRARAHMEMGAVTGGYRADREKVVRMLNEALATEIICVLRYQSHFHRAEGIHAKTVAAEFQEHAAEEQVHADRLAERIMQIHGVPNFNPEGLLSRSHTVFGQGGSLVDMIREDLVAERIAVDSYTEMIRFVKDDDPTTRRMLEDILASEERHADEMANLLSTLDPTRESPPEK